MSFSQYNYNFYGHVKICQQLKSIWGSLPLFLHYIFYFLNIGGKGCYQP